MVEIRYGEQYEVADLAGQTVSEAREQFRAEFGIPERATAKLNGAKVKGNIEFDTVLNDDDKLTFAVARNRGAFLVGALLLALAATGGVFAFGFVNGATSIGASVVESNFADVSVNNSFSGENWLAFGFYKGSIPAGSLFDVNPAPGYTGDLAVTVTLGNADQLSKIYRMLALQLYMTYSDGGVVDIDESTDNGSGSIDTDWVVLSLNNGSVSMFPQGTPSDNMTVMVKGGFYITNVRPNTGWSGSASPALFCEVAQR